jgi:hypothetical protein
MCIRNARKTFERRVPLDMPRTVIPSLFPQAIIEAISNSGHYPMEETPLYRTTRIEKFMSERQ